MLEQKILVYRREVEPSACFLDNLRIPFWLLGKPSYCLTQAFALRQQGIAISWSSALFPAAGFLVVGGAAI
jgi:hypothetical protein